ncbi:CoA-binding protein [Rhodococcus sp. NPDC057529]|uniref:CoA-binding protein n=1 Tax=Rhodococcus sp. NPDC057529 TaxID=3346158 RepID=UPI00366CB3B4
MTTAVADLLFRPRNVVVYGASSDPAKLSGRPLDYLKKFGYAGGIYAINPHRNQVQGVPAYADISDIDAPIDLAIIVVPAAAVVEAVERCANAGVGTAIIFASGFAEIGDPGTAIQDRITAVARRSGMRVVGPNCLGSFSAGNRAFATFSTAFDDEGERPDSPIALVSQSGAVGTFTYSTMNSLGLGARYFANTGNEADVTVVELLAGLVDAPDVNLLLGHIEGVKDFAALEGLMRSAADHGKPLILLKAGRSPAGSRAVAAHTASIAGDDDAFEQAVTTYGAIRVHSMEAMADAALAFAAGRAAAGRRLTVVTQSGGAGALATDTAVELGLVVEPWQSADRERLASHLPYFASTANPIDATGSLINDVGILTRTLQVVCDNDDTDAVLVVLGNSDASADAMVEALRRAYAATSKPFFVAWTGGSGRPRRQLLDAGIPTYPEPSRAVRVLSYLVEHSLRRAVESAAG